MSLFEPNEEEFAELKGSVVVLTGTHDWQAPRSECSPANSVQEGLRASELLL